MGINKAKVKIYGQEYTISGVAVSGVGNHGAAVLGGAFGEEEIGAGVGGAVGRQHCQQHEGCGEESGFLHGVWGFIVVFVFLCRYSVIT